MRYSVFAAFAVVCGQQVAAQGECAGIENDIGRLQCYDSYFRDEPTSEAPTTKAPSDAFLELARLAQFQDDSQSQELMLDGCTLRIITVAGRDAFGARNSMGVTSFDLTQVREVSPAFSTDTVEVILEREVPAQIFSFNFQREPITPQYMGTVKAWFLENARNDFADVNFVNGGEVKDSQAIGWKHFYPLEQGQIVGALRTLVRSCKELGG